jgi:hypothetical protein
MERERELELANKIRSLDLSGQFGELRRKFSAVAASAFSLK